MTPPDNGDEPAGGYVHEPAGPPTDEQGAMTVSEGSRLPEGDRSFGWRGWVLVGWLFVAFVVVPTYLFFFPRASDALALFGLSYHHTYLILPLVPALILGALAVWTAIRG